MPQSQESSVFLFSPLTVKASGKGKGFSLDRFARGTEYTEREIITIWVFKSKGAFSLRTLRPLRETKVFFARPLR